MDESDNMLVASIRQLGFTLSERIQNLSDVNSEDMNSICLQFMEMYKIDTSQIRQLGKNQKFRIATKINQQLTKNFGTQYQLNDLMNPSINFCRKLIVSFVSKLSLNQIEGKKDDQQFQNSNQSNTRYLKQKRVDVMNTWIKRQWIHPSLNSTKNVNYQCHRLRYDMNQDIQKRNILKDFSNQQLRYNLQGTLAEMMNQYFLAKKRTSDQQGIIMNKQAAAGDRLQEIKQNNAEDWIILKKNNKKINKLKKKLISQAKVQNTEKVQIPVQATVFKKQVQQLVQQQRIKQQASKKQKDKNNDKNSQQAESTKEDPLGKLKFDVQKLKKSHQSEIESLINLINSKQKKITKIQDKEQKIQEETVLVEERIQKLKQNYTKTKKQAQSKQLLLNTIQIPQQMKQEVKNLKQEVKQIDIEAKKQIQKLQEELKKLQNEGSQKITVLKEIKDKLIKIQQDYAKINRDIIQKQNEKKNIKIPQAGISRNYYNKKISEMQVRWKQGKKQIQKVNIQLTKLQQSININVSVSGRIQTQIQNLMNLDKQKNDALNKTIKQLYQKYKISFKSTLQSMNNVTQVKSESRQYESKVSELSGKNYKLNIDKITFALEDIRKQRQIAQKRK